MRVSSAELIKNYGALSDNALVEPVTITKNGRDRLVLVSWQEFQRLKRLDDRQAVLPEEMSEEDLAAIAQGEMSAEHAHLDAEAAGWQP